MRRQECLLPALQALGPGSECRGLPACGGPACSCSCRWAERLAASVERPELFRPAPGLSIFHCSLLFCFPRQAPPTPRCVETSERCPTATPGLPGVSPAAELQAPLLPAPVGWHKDAGPGWPTQKVLTQSAIVWGWSVRDKWKGFQNQRQVIFIHGRAEMPLFSILGNKP